MDACRSDAAGASSRPSRSRSATTCSSRISQIDGQIVIKIFGDDSTLLKRYRRQMLSRRSQDVRGRPRAFVDRDGRLPAVQHRHRSTRQRRATASTLPIIQDVVESALGGKATTELWEGERHFAVVVRLQGRVERSVHALADLLIEHPERCARSRCPRSPSSGDRRRDEHLAARTASGSRSIGIFIRDRDMGSVVADMQRVCQRRKFRCRRATRSSGRASSRTSNARWRASR